MISKFDFDVDGNVVVGDTTLLPSDMWDLIRKYLDENCPRLCIDICANECAHCSLAEKRAEIGT